MSLTNRFSILLLVTLGLTLAGFSTALVVSSRIYLNRQVDDRLTAILTLLLRVRKVMSAGAGVPRHGTSSSGILDRLVS